MGSGTTGTWTVGTATGTKDWSTILRLVAEGLGVAPDSLTLVGHEVVACVTETRLRFNAPTPVDAWTLNLHLRTADGISRMGEVELFHWLSDEEWELSELAF